MSEAPVAVAEAYYDSRDADAFYLHVWGGEDIHIGLYDQPDEAIRDASRRTIRAMAERLGGLAAHSRVLDLGAGYGGAARYLARRFDCHVTCLNLSETQNSRNRVLTEQAGLSHRVAVVHGNFEAIPEPDASFDVVWSQDAILHSGDREQVLREVARVLRPGGKLIFTDPMQAEAVPEGALDGVLARIHLDSLGSIGFYRRAAAEQGLCEVGVEVLTPHLVRHYGRVRQELQKRRNDLDGRVSGAYIERMLEGLERWVDAGKAGHLSWGILQFRRAH